MTRIHRKWCDHWEHSLPEELVHIVSMVLIQLFPTNDLDTGATEAWE